MQPLQDFEGILMGELKGAIKMNPLTWKKVTQTFALLCQSYPNSHLSRTCVFCLVKDFKESRVPIESVHKKSSSPQNLAGHQM